MTAGNVVVVVLSITLLCAAGYVFYIKHKPEKFSRERYAFAALLATANLVALGIAAVTGKTPQSALGEIWSLISGAPRSESPPMDFAEQALLLIFIGFVIYIIHRTFVTWNGAFSTQDRQRRDLHEERVWVVDGLSEFARVVRREPPRPLYRLPEPFREPPVPPPPESYAWRDNARDLVELHSRSYSFPLDGWHDLASAWVGKNERTNGVVGLLCVSDVPTDSRLVEFATYVARLPGSRHRPSNTELIVAVQDGTISERKKLGDFEFRLESQSALLDDLVDFSDYFREIERRVMTDTLPDSDLKINDVYVRPIALRGDIDARTAEQSAGEDLHDLLSKWLTESGQRQIALLGEYGQGKSTSALMFTYSLIEQATKKSGRVPLLIELRGVSPSTLPPLQLLGAWCSSYRIEPRSLFKLIVAGRVITIFEGFDEMAEAGDPEARLNHFRALWKFAYSQNKMIITGRPNFFLDEVELKTALGVERASGAGPYCAAYYLKFFDFDQIARSLRSVKNSQVRQQIVALARSDRRFLDIVARPSLLYIVAILWESEHLSDRPSLNSAEVIELFTRHSYRRQSQKEEAGREFMLLSAAEREYFMDGIAAYMASRRLNNQILPDQFHDAISKLFDAIPDRINLTQPATNSAPTKTLKDRLVGRRYPIGDVQTDVRAYGILVADYSKPGALRFAHKSFFEFTFARLVAYRLLGLEKERAAAIVAATNISLDSITDMPESLGFLGEIVGQGSNISSKIPVSTDAGSQMQSLFNVIVLKNKIRLNYFFSKMIILELAGNRENNEGLLKFTYRNIERPSSLIATSIFLIFFTYKHLSKYHTATEFSFTGTWLLFTTSNIMMALVISQSIVVIPTFVGIIRHVFLQYTRIDKALRLWYLVIRHMRLGEIEISKVYGRLSARRLASFY